MASKTNTLIVPPLLVKKYIAQFEGASLWDAAVYAGVSMDDLTQAEHGRLTDPKAQVAIWQACYRSMGKAAVHSLVLEMAAQVPLRNSTAIRMPMPGERTYHCLDCQEDKVAEAFQRNAQGGVFSLCKECMNVRIALGKLRIMPLEDMTVEVPGDGESASDEVKTGWEDLSLWSKLERDSLAGRAYALAYDLRNIEEKLANPPVIVQAQTESETSERLRLQVDYWQSITKQMDEENFNLREQITTLRQYHTERVELLGTISGLTQELAATTKMLETLWQSYDKLVVELKRYRRGEEEQQDRVYQAVERWKASEQEEEEERAEQEYEDRERWIMGEDEYNKIGQQGEE